MQINLCLSVLTPLLLSLNMSGKDPVYVRVSFCHGKINTGLFHLLIQDYFVNLLNS
jgi:hypothetical protein